MAQHLTWLFKTPRRVTLDGAARSIDLQYEAAGFRSGWTVVVDGHAAGTCPDLISAQEQALRLAHETPMQEAA